MSAESSSDGGQTVNPIDCEHAVRRLWDYLDGRLPDLAREEVEAHLATCELCAPRFVFARKMQHALHERAERDQRSEPKGAAEPRLRTRVREALKKQIASSGSRPANNEPDAPSD